MAHGAPDHTRLSDNAYAHYSYQRPWAAGWVILPGDERSLYDFDLVGVFGLASMRVNNKYALLDIEVDGIEIFLGSPDYAFSSHGFYKGALDGVTGVSIFNEIDNDYTLWFKTDWNVYVHNHLKIAIQNETLNNVNVSTVRGHILTYR